MDIFLLLLQLISGLFVFLYGVDLLSEGLEKVACPKLLTFLDKAAGNRIKGLLFGAVAVGIMQSSSMLMVTMIGLINAGMLSLENAVGIMLGAEIGTTITGQLVAFNFKSIDLVFLSIGFCLLFFTQHKKLQMIGQPLFGIGLAFLGMRLMTSAGESFSQMAVFQKLLETMSQNVLLGVFTGAILTALIHSSSGMTGLVIAMGSSHSIALNAAISLILGANIGTCVTGWIVALRSSPNAKRASYAQIFINISGVLLFLPFINPYAKFIATTSNLLPRQIANAHTIFNIIVSLLMIPIVTPLTKLMKIIIPKTEKEERREVTKYINSRTLTTPFVAVSLAKAEVLRMGGFTLQMLKNAQKSFVQGKIKNASEVLGKEPDIDAITHKLDRFIDDIPADKLNPADRAELGRIRHIITDIERVGDHAVNLAEFALQMEKKKINFSKYARKELALLFDTVIENYITALKAFKKEDLSLLEQVAQLEEKIDEMEKQCKKNHIERLKKGLCQPEADPIYLDTLRNLERISDHSYNIALSIKY